MPLPEGDVFGPKLLSRQPEAFGNHFVGDMLAFTFDEAVRLKAGAVLMTDQDHDVPVRVETSFSADQRTLYVRPLDLAVPAVVEVHFRDVTDLAGNAWSGYGHRYEYPQWVRSIPERFEPAKSAYQLTAAVGSDGAPVVAWSEGSDTCSASLRARRYDGTRWQDLGIPNAVPTPRAQSASLAAGGGRVAMAWEQSGAGCQSTEIHVAMLGPTGFTPVGGPVTSGSTGVYSPSLALDAQGRPVVAWQSGASPVVRAARWDGAAWVSLGETVNDAGRLADASSLALAPDGKPCVAFTDRQAAADPAQLHVRCFDGSAWRPLGGSVESSMGGFTGLSSRALAFDARGAALVAYAKYYDGVQVAEHTEAGWRVSVAGGVKTTRWYPELVVDPVLGPVVGFCEDVELRASVRGATGWSETGWPERSFGNDISGLGFVAGCALAAGPTGPWMPWLDDDNTYGMRVRVERYNR